MSTRFLRTTSTGCYTPSNGDPFAALGDFTSLLIVRSDFSAFTNVPKALQSS
jgi:hypothetical protein